MSWPKSDIPDFGRGEVGRVSGRVKGSVATCEYFSPQVGGERTEIAALSFFLMRGRHAIHGWLLLLPAMALLALFTHWPALATFIDSFYSTPRPRRPARFIGLDNYRDDRRRPGVLAVASVNNLWFALGTIPVSIALAILMALWVNDRIAGRTLVRMAYFTPTMLPMIAVANIWLFFYTPQYGLLEQIARRIRLAIAQLARLAATRRWLP